MSEENKNNKIVELVPGSVPDNDHESITPYDPLSLYINKIKQMPLLGKEEEHDLAVKYLNEKDRDAAYRLVTSHLMLVVKISMGFRRIYHNVMELIQEGNVGLMEAVKRFDPYKGARFSTYATWWIRAFILKFIVDNLRMVRVGTTNMRRKLLFKLRGEIEKLELEGFRPEPKLLAERFNATESDIIDVAHTLSSPDISFDAPLSNDSNDTFIDLFKPDYEHPEEEMARDQLKKAFHDKVATFAEDLNDYTRAILRQRILAETPKTLREIGEEHGVTREAVRQAEERLRKKLMEFLKKELEGHV